MITSHYQGLNSIYGSNTDLVLAQPVIISVLISLEYFPACHSDMSLDHAGEAGREGPWEYGPHASVRGPDYIVTCSLGHMPGPQDG